VVPVRGVEILQPFDYRGVTLDDGPLKSQFDEVRDYYLRIPNDDLLRGFRMRAGLPAPGVDLGGWYSSDTFHIFGQILSGLSRMYAATGDPACRDKAVALYRGWRACIAPDGFFFYSNHPNAPHYIFDKMVGGLVDLARYCGQKDAIASLSRIADWAIEHLDRTRPFGGDPNEWYTLSENLYRAYLLTGDPKYREFGRVWEYTEYWSRYARGVDIFAPPGGRAVPAYHAYSHVNTLGGCGAAYAVGGDPCLLRALENAYDTLQKQQCFPTGGYGPDEALLPHKELLERLAKTHASFETQCGSWAAFKMCKYLLRFTGDARYGDWVESLILNGIGAGIPMTSNGRVFYYSDYNPNGAAKVNHGDGWTCCAGTRPMAAADFHDLIYFHSPDFRTLLVNLYTPSTVRWKLGADEIALQQRTRFPARETAEFTLLAARPERLTLAFRMPAWLAGAPRIEVDGHAAPAAALQHSLRVTRTWRSGDKITLILPMDLRSVSLDAPRTYPAMLRYGPVALALRGTPKEIAGRVDPAKPASSLLPVEGDSLTWRLAWNPGVLVRPFYAFKEGEPYVITLDPNAANRISFRDLAFSGAWNENGEFRFSNAVGATASAEFDGTGIRWLGYRFDDAGHAEVRIDGKPVAIVDQYGPGRQLPFDWHIDGLPRGHHKLLLTLLPDRSPASKDRFLNVAGFQVAP
jgi:DUF1680 family protein